MKNIKTIDYKENGFEGMWNEKTYASTIPDKPELIRIYIDNKMVHITDEAYHKLLDDNAVHEYGRQEHVKETLKTMSFQNKLNVLSSLLNDNKFIEFCKTDKNISSCRKNLIDFIDMIYEEEISREITDNDDVKKAKRLVIRADMSDEYITLFDDKKMSSKNKEDVDFLCRKGFKCQYDHYNMIRDIYDIY